MTKIYNLFQNSKIYLENIIQFSLKIFLDFFFNMLYIFSVLQVQVRPVRAAHPGLKANLQDVKLVRPGTSSLATNKEKIIKVRLIVFSLLVSRFQDFLPAPLKILRLTGSRILGAIFWIILPAPLKRPRFEASWLQASGSCF